MLPKITLEVISNRKNQLFNVKVDVLDNKVRVASAILQPNASVISLKSFTRTVVVKTSLARSIMDTFEKSCKLSPSDSSIQSSKT